MVTRLSLVTLVEVIQKCGFALCGVTDPSPLAAYTRYREWLGGGFHADMQFLEDTKRSDPRLIFPQARSILVLAARYPAHVPYAQPAGLTGRVSAHAWGQDYHTVLRQRAERVAR
jgi:epoxyqueuosine reductase